MSPEQRRLLDEERAKRGMAATTPIVRETPAPRAPVAPEEEWHCHWCKEDYPKSAFNHGGNAFPKSKVCNACFDEKYGVRQWVKCTGCRRLMQTRGAKNPKCRPCRQADKDKAAESARFPPLCISCGKSAGSAVFVGPNCRTCHDREVLKRWRAA